MNPNTVRDAIDKINAMKIVTSSGCWEIDKSLNKGYPMIKVKGKQWRCSRLYYTYAIGPIPRGMFVCHTCDNPLCVNPDHLFLGNARDNNLDMLGKGRAKPPKGEKHHTTKFNVAQIIDIRELYAMGSYNQYQLARIYHVTVQTINNIVRGKTWKDVDGPITNTGHVNPPSKSGEDSPNAILTEENIREIRSLYAAGGISFKKIGDRYGVNATHIYRIVKRQAWAHVD